MNLQEQRREFENQIVEIDQKVTKAKRILRQDIEDLVVKFTEKTGQAISGEFSVIFDEDGNIGPATRVGNITA